MVSSVGAKVFVAEAARDLEVAIHAADHQQLLEELRRLRQGVELAGMDTAGDEVVARALGGGARHDRRLDLVEALGGEVVANGQRDAVAHLDVGVHLRASQVDVAVLQPHLFVDVGVGIAGRKRRHLALVEQLQAGGDHLDLAGIHLGIDGALIAQLDLAGDGQHVLAAHALHALVKLRAALFVEDNLGDAGAVAEIDKDQVAVIAAAVDPAHESDGLACIGGTQFAATMRPL